MKDVIRICAQCLSLTFLLIGLINASKVYLFAGAGIFDLLLVTSLILVSRLNESQIKDNAANLTPLNKVSAALMVPVLFVGVSCLTSEIKYVKITGMLVWSFFIASAIIHVLITKQPVSAILGYSRIPRIR